MHVFFFMSSWDEFTRGPPPVRKQQHENSRSRKPQHLLASHMEMKIPIAMKILDATEIHVRQLIYVYIYMYSKKNEYFSIYIIYINNKLGYGFTKSSQVHISTYRAVSQQKVVDTVSLIYSLKMFKRTCLFPIVLVIPFQNIFRYHGVGRASKKW